MALNSEQHSETVTAEELKRLTVIKLEHIHFYLQNKTLEVNEILEEVELAFEALHTLDSNVRIPQDIFRDLLTAKRILEKNVKTCSRTPKVFTGTAGRPSYDISREQLEGLLGIGFNVSQIAEILQVGKRTIERRVSHFGISARSFTDISDDDLDSIVREIKLFYPNIGSKNLAGHLASRSIKVPRARIRDSLRRVDPLGIAARKCQSIHRRVYCVSRPLALWHLDGNHKLIRWRFVVHGCVDGYTRIPVFLHCHMNNRANTVLESFLTAVQEWGLPSRVRCDRGGENVDVVEYMLHKRGTGRGSALVGRSVHNQRVERLWRDVYRDVLDLFYGIFMSMEDIGLLDPINEIDLWCLHYCFCHVINMKLKSWASAWIRHPLSSEQNKTPLQLWVQGNFENAERTLQDQSIVGDDYGIDWNGPASLDTYFEQDVEVAETNSPLSQQQLDELNAEFAQNFPNNSSPYDSVRSYQFVKNFTLQCNTGEI